MGLKRGRTGRNTSLPKIGRRKVKSQFEFDLYKELTGITGGSRASVSYEDTKLEYTETKQYIPDLVVRYSGDNDGERTVYIEGKGYFPYSERAKMIAVKEQHPDLDIRIVFYRDTPSSLGKGSKMRPSDWAQKYGFPSAVKTIPEEWFSE